MHLLLLLDYDKETNSLNKSDETKTLELIIICFGEAKVDGYQMTHQCVHGGLSERHSDSLCYYCRPHPPEL